MVDINPTISIIALNVNGLNVPIKRQRSSEWIKMQNPTICCLQETHVQYIKTLAGYKKMAGENIRC